jgi:hypothetical protein
MFKVGDMVTSQSFVGIGEIVSIKTVNGVNSYFIKVKITGEVVEHKLQYLTFISRSDTQEQSVGIKHDQSKPPMDLLPYDSLEEVAKVLGFGAKKYERANWAKGINQSRLIAAALRHIGQFNNGEDFDKESETLHLANAACNLLFAIWMYKNRPDMDDRWVKSIKGKNENI